MDTDLFDYIDGQLPNFNPVIAEGLACKHLEQAELYIDRVLKEASKDFPPGFEYVRYSYPTPKEIYEYVSAKRNNRQTVEMSESTLRMIFLHFRHNGEDQKPRPLYLPYARPGGLISLMGSRFAVSPVISDRAISVNEESIFIPLNRDRLTFFRHRYVFNILNEGPSAAWVPYINLHHASGKRSGLMSTAKPIMDAKCSNAHYLFCKYGVYATFALCGAEIAAGYSEINPVNYNSEEWVICESMMAKPRGLRTRSYIPSQLRIAVRREQFTLRIRSVMAALFYLIDHFPDRISPAEMNGDSLMRILLGHLIFASNESEGKLKNNVDSHMNSIDRYIDGMVLTWLKEANVFVENIYDLFLNIIDTFTERVATSSNTMSSMYGKRLVILRYALFDITSSINAMLYALQKKAKKPLTATDINGILNKYLNPRLAIRMNSGHAEVSSVSSATDNNATRISLSAVLQTRTSANGARSKTASFGPSLAMHASLIDVCQYNNLPKSEPTGRERLNPYLNLSHDYMTLPNEKYRALLEEMQETIFKR